MPVPPESRDQPPPPPQRLEPPPVPPPFAEPVGTEPVPPPRPAPVGRARGWVANCLASLYRWLTLFGNACARNWRALDRTGRLMVACLGAVSLCCALLAIGGWSRQPGGDASSGGAKTSNPVTVENLRKLQNGQTWKEVVRVMGPPDSQPFAIPDAHNLAVWGPLDDRYPYIAIFFDSQDRASMICNNQLGRPVPDALHGADWIKNAAELVKSFHDFETGGEEPAW